MISPKSKIQHSASRETQHATRNTQHATRTGFTLIELLLAMAIMAVVLSMAAPIIYKRFHGDALPGAAKSVIEVLSTARARAVLQATKTEVVFHPQQRRLELAGGGSGGKSSLPAIKVRVGTPSAACTSAQLPDDVFFEMLDVNLAEYRDADEVHVRFYPDGRCDELFLILNRQGEQCGISLEVTTSLATYLNDRDLQTMRK